MKKTDSDHGTFLLLSRTSIQISFSPLPTFSGTVGIPPLLRTINPPFHTAFASPLSTVKGRIWRQNVNSTLPSTKAAFCCNSLKPQPADLVPGSWLFLTSPILRAPTRPAVLNFFPPQWRPDRVESYSKISSSLPSAFLKRALTFSPARLLDFSNFRQVLGEPCWMFFFFFFFFFVLNCELREKMIFSPLISTPAFFSPSK